MQNRPEPTRADVEAFVAMYLAQGFSRPEAELRARYATDDEVLQRTPTATDYDVE